MSALCNRQSSIRLSKPLLLLCASIVGLFFVTPVFACNVPVFRYALERWRVDRYEMILFHRGELSDEERQIVDVLKKYDQGTDGFPLCLTIDLVDLDKNPDKDVLALFEKHKNAKLPWLVAYAPIRGLEEPLFAGKLHGDLVQNLLFSPKRRVVAERILNGQTAVCVLLESGDAKKDDKAAELLEAEMQKMPAKLKLPELTDDPADALREDAPPLRIDFSLLRLSREDPREKMLIEMLLVSEPDLKATEEPMAFFVFGRGRSLWALVGEGITKENIQEACAFLVGACSCEVKRQNPGFDLLIDVDWESGLTGKWVKPPEPPPLSGLAPTPPPPSTEERDPTKREPNGLSRKVPFWERPMFRTAAIAGGAAFLLLLVGTIVLLKRS